MPAAQTAQVMEYKNLAEMPPVEVWTPKGSYTAPRRIDREEMPTNTTYIQVALEANNRKPRQRILTSGEWYQIREMLHETDPKLEESMINGNYERNSTFLDFTHGKRKKNYYDGLLIQVPEMDEEGNILTDRGILKFDKEGNPVPESGIIKAKHVFEMALPLESGYVKEMHTRFSPFRDTIYGMKDSEKTLPDYAFVSITSEGVRNLLRGYGGWHYREDGRVGVNGLWGPLDPGGNVAARAAADASLKYELDVTDFEAAIRTLRSMKSTPLSEVQSKLKELEGILSRATAREEDI